MIFDENCIPILGRDIQPGDTIYCAWFEKFLRVSCIVKDELSITLLFCTGQNYMTFSGQTFVKKIEVSNGSKADS